MFTTSRQGDKPHLFLFGATVFAVGARGHFVAGGRGRTHSHGLHHQTLPQVQAFSNNASPRYLSLSIFLPRTLSTLLSLSLSLSLPLPSLALSLPFPPSLSPQVIPHPGFISSQVSSCPALGASTPVRMLPLSTWITFTGRSLIWLVSSRGWAGWGGI